MPYISVVIVTKNEESRISDCLKTVRPYFSDIWVVDSQSQDQTVEIARRYGARIIDFQWNGAYPKKYGWCLENLDELQDWVLFLDADEWMSEDLAREIEALDFSCAGYFIKARYRIGNRVLKFGLKNNKLCLINRHKMRYPHVKDLGIEGAYEIEGHYQPVLRAGYKREKIGQLKNEMIHCTDLDSPEWLEKHQRYARWEAMMDVKKLWPKQNSTKRIILKMIFKSLPFRSLNAFIHSYVFKLGVLDGWSGFDMAVSRYRYYCMINNEKRVLKANKAKV